MKNILYKYYSVIATGVTLPQSFKNLIKKKKKEGGSVLSF